MAERGDGRLDKASWPGWLGRSVTIVWARTRVVGCMQSHPSKHLLYDRIVAPPIALQHFFTRPVKLAKENCNDTSVEHGCLMSDRHTCSEHGLQFVHSYVP
jgi:hypothetical protein